MGALTTEELNFLVFRYLYESGLEHAAFTLGYEAGINKSTIDGNLVPPRGLITLVEKGLQYTEMEVAVNTDNSDADMDEVFSLFKPSELIQYDVNQLRQLAKDRMKELQMDREKDKELEKEHEAERTRVKEKERLTREKESEKSRVRVEKNEQEKHHKDHSDGNRVTKHIEKMNANHEENVYGVEPLYTSTAPTSQSCDIPSSDVTILEGHTAEVCTCAWSPTESLLASGSGDWTARIWPIPDGSSRSGLQSLDLDVVELEHFMGTRREKSKYVTALDWNGKGTLLATGSSDGEARIWTTDGELASNLIKHKGAIYSLKWNKKGDYLLTGSSDKTAIVWDIKKESVKQQFDFHTGVILDVDWRNNLSFAMSSKDNKIYLTRIGQSIPIKTFTGHQGEVNCVKWDPTGKLLASCSDDSSAKIWTTNQKKYVHDLREHSKVIYTVRWSPTGPGTNNPNQKLVLASASSDSTVKLWDSELGKLLYSLNGHRGPVFSVAFSPNGEYLVSGGADKSIHIWSLKEGKIVKTYTGSGMIREVCWNKDGDKIAACLTDSTVCVLNFRR